MEIISKAAFLKANICDTFQTHFFKIVKIIAREIIHYESRFYHLLKKSCSLPCFLRVVAESDKEYVNEAIAKTYGLKDKSKNSKLAK